VTWTHIREYKFMYFFIIICLYSQVCNEFFFGVFGLVLVPECLPLKVRTRHRLPPLPSAPDQLPEAGVSATFASSTQRLQKSLRSLANGHEGMLPWLRLGEALTLAQVHRHQFGSAPMGLAPCFVFCSSADNELKDILDFFFTHCVKFQVSIWASVCPFGR